MLFSLHARSEDYILKKLVEEAVLLNQQVKDLYELQCVKADINKRIVRGILEHGRRYERELDAEKQKIFNVIEKQKSAVKSIVKVIAKVRQMLDLLIHMEQASLAIHSGLKRDDLSGMVDVREMPLEKFRGELEQIQMLNSSFDILRVELEKQKEYIKSFTLSSTADEHYFHQSQKYESELSEQEIISVNMLREFCHDLTRMIDARMGRLPVRLSDSDKAALSMVSELKRVKMRRGFFSLSVYHFLKGLVSRNVRSRQIRKLSGFLLLFLFSRLKKFKMSSYYAQLRVSVLVYNLMSSTGEDSSQRDLVAGAALMINMIDFEDIDPKKAPEIADEVEIVKGYYSTVRQIFSEEFQFLDKVLDEYHGRTDELRLKWISRGAQLIRLAEGFDDQLHACQFSPEEVSKKRDSIRSGLVEKQPGTGPYIDYLLANWAQLLSRDLTQA